MARYEIEQRSGSHKLIVGVRCRFGSSRIERLALLDTGAQWSVIGADVAEMVADDLGEASGNFRMKSRYGSHEANLQRLAIHIVAEKGRELCVDGTVAVIRDWPGPPVLGYGGFMERLRVALDPGCTEDCHIFYFGQVGASSGNLLLFEVS